MCAGQSVSHSSGIVLFDHRSAGDPSFRPLWSVSRLDPPEGLELASLKRLDGKER